MKTFQQAIPLVVFDQFGFTCGSAAETQVRPDAINQSTLTCVGTLATFVAASNHGLDTGMVVTVANASIAGYNGTFVVTVTALDTFTYVVPVGGLGPASNATFVRDVQAQVAYIYNLAANSGTMSIGPASGSYVDTINIGGTYEVRAPDRTKFKLSDFYIYNNGGAPGNYKVLYV